MSEPVKAEGFVWDAGKLKRFKRIYAATLAAAEGGGREAIFTFEGCRFVVGYAGYLIQYLEGKGL